jgi:hypothetical protein
MAVRKRRKPIQREAVGKTKSDVLIFMLSNNECTITDVRRYLRNEKNIRNVKGVRKHISDLVSENLIKIKKAERRGLGDIYYAERTFTDFRNIFNFLQSFYRPPFLRTKYAKEMISEDDFFLYGMVNIAREIFTELIKLTDERHFNDLIEKAKRNGEDIPEAEISYEKIKKAFERYDIEGISKSLKEIKVEEIIDYLKESFVSDKNINFNAILTTMLQSLFPDAQRDEIINIISASHSSLDYFLNLRSAGRYYFFVNVIRFYLSAMFVDKDKNALMKGIAEDDSVLERDFMSSILKLSTMENVLNDDPLSVILRSYFVVDAFNGNIVENEYSTKTLKDILIPKVKQ